MGESKARETVLVVDDSEDALELARRHLEGAGYRVLLAQGATAAIEQLSAGAIDLVMTDLRMPGISGLDLIRHVRENYKDTEVLMITGYPSVEGAVEAMRFGAADYLPKPFTAPELRTAVERALTKLRARQSLARAEPETSGKLSGFIGTCDGMRGVIRSILDFADRPDPVLILGEMGTGRRAVARRIHSAGRRGAEEFFEYDCTIPASERGKRHPLEPAAEPDFRAGLRDRGPGRTIGTLYLHEVHALSVQDQDRLMAAGWARPEGAATAGHPAPRLVLSSSADLAAMAARGAIGTRLQTNLAGRRITLLPLRERGEDLLLLVRSFAGQAAEQLALPSPAFTDRAIEVLQAYPWPGNVRELWRTIRQAVIRTNAQTVDAPDLPSHMRYAAHAVARLDRPLAEVEAAYVLEVLASVNGNRSRAAEILGIDRKTLREKLRRA